LFNVGSKRTKLTIPLELGIVFERSSFAENGCRHDVERPETEAAKVDRQREVKQLSGCFPEFMHFIRGI
jgi:hypothetical protein